MQKESLTDGVYVGDGIRWMNVVQKFDVGVLYVSVALF